MEVFVVFIHLPVFLTGYTYIASCAETGAVDMVQINRRIG